MDILKSGRLIWSIYDYSLDEGDVTLDGHPIIPTDLNLLNQPIRLKTPNLVLHFLPIKYGHEERFEFPTGPVVTPLQILGAIYTYYSQPLTEEELNRLEATGTNMADRIVDRARREMRQWKIVLRSWIMGDDIFLKDLQEARDGSFLVQLWS